METFKLEKACGMTPDPSRLSWLRNVIAADEEKSGREESQVPLAIDYFEQYVAVSPLSHACLHFI